MRHFGFATLVTALMFVGTTSVQGFHSDDTGEAGELIPSFNDSDPNLMMGPLDSTEGQGFFIDEQPFESIEDIYPKPVTTPRLYSPPSTAPTTPAKIPGGGFSWTGGTGG